MIARLREILLRYPGVRLAYVFGSYARGVVRPLSDLDIAVVVEDPRCFCEDLENSQLG